MAMPDDPTIVDRRQPHAALWYLTSSDITVAELARLYEVKTATVRVWLDAELVPERRDRWDGAWTAEDLAMARRMEAAGWTLEQAAQRFSVARRTLRRAARAAGFGLVLWPSPTEGKAANRRVGPQHRNAAAVVDRFRQGGVSVGWLAAEYEANRDSIRKWLTAAGLNPDSPPAGRDS